MWLLVVGAGGYWLSCMGKRVIFRPRRTCWPMQLPFEKIIYRQLAGGYLPPQPGRETLVFFHGRGGNISHFESFALTYAKLGYGILMFDYRGFGLSKGTASQRHIKQDVQTVLDYAFNVKKISPSQLVLYGHSLGSAAALYAAQQGAPDTVKALILQSPFLSTPDVAASWATGTYRPHTAIYRLIRCVVTPFLYPNFFDNTRLISGLSMPVLVCMSRQDTLLPWQQSARLAQQIPHAQHWVADSGGHDEFAWAAPTVNQFITRQVPS